MDKQQQANTQEQEQDKAERLKRAAAAAKALSAKKKAQAEAAAATDVASDTASAESKVDTDKGSAKDSGTTTNNGDDKAARLARAAAAAKALSAKKKAAAAAASTDKATADKPESSQDKDKADLSADDKAARLARASAAAKALAAKKKAAAQGQDASEAKADKTADKSDSALTDEEKEARIARAAAAAKALAAKKKAEKAEASTTEEAKADTASTKSPAPAPATPAKAKSTGKASTNNKESGSNSANNNKALWRSLFAGFILAFIAALCTVGVLLAQHDTNEAIAHNRALQEQQLVRSLLPEIMEREESQGRKVKFECKLISHRLIGHNMRAYIVHNEEDQILGFISSYSTSRGYSNPLILIGGINPQGQISKIDVQLSRETPGIGDKVERRRGNFLDQFDGQNLHSIKWDVKKFGGDFDYITGATVTSRALVLATRDFLEVMATTDLTTLPDCSR